MKIETIKFDGFEAFLKEVLIPSGTYWKKLDGFVFRGEKTNMYKLLPGALRENQVDNLYRSGKPIDDQWKWLTWQINAEYSILREFYKAANNSGLKVPQIDSIAQNYVDLFPTELMHQRGSFSWISEDLAELAALAQHYGLLTRLIDWSYDIYVALYFACLGAVKDRQKKPFDKNDTFVIWALNAQYIQFLQPTTSRIPIKFIVPSYYNNPNLNAQKGILSYWEIMVPDTYEQIRMMHEENRVLLTDRTPLDVLLQQYCDAYPNKNEHLSLLYKFEIPISECIPAFEYIMKLGYTTAKLFPGYDGVVRSMKEQTLLYEIKKQESLQKSEMQER